MNQKKLIMLLIIVFNFLMSNLLAIGDEQDVNEIFRIVNEFVGSIAGADPNRIERVLTTKNDILFVAPIFGVKKGRGDVIDFLRWFLPGMGKAQMTLTNVVCIMRGEEASVNGDYRWQGDIVLESGFVALLRKEKKGWKMWALDIDDGKEIQPFAPEIQKLIQTTLSAYATEDVSLLEEVISDDMIFFSLKGTSFQGKEDSLAALREEFTRNDNIQLTFNNERLVVYLADQENLATVSIPFVYQCANEPQQTASGHLTFHQVESWHITRLEFEKIPCELNKAYPWDVNGDNEVNISDLVLVGRHFGEITSEGDVNGDGQVDISDLVLVGSHFGESYGLAAPLRKAEGRKR